GVLIGLIVPAYAARWGFAQESCARSRDPGALYVDPDRQAGVAGRSATVVARLGGRTSVGCAAAARRMIREMVCRSRSAHSAAGVTFQRRPEGLAVFISVRAIPP